MDYSYPVTNDDLIPHCLANFVDISYQSKKGSYRYLVQGSLKIWSFPGKSHVVGNDSQFFLSFAQMMIQKKLLPIANLLSKYN